ncbi:MAG: glycogen/starch synthase [Flavobacteriales bacterium]
MEKQRVLFVTQEISPFLSATEIAEQVKQIALATHDSGKEIRIFTPRFGCINERRHQLHEVIRLSGMNLVINDADHPLIIKVASIPGARVQVYFIDNEEYFQRKAVLTTEDEKFFGDNDERSIFFCRGVLETVKKLGWVPDVIHCHGWMTAFMPLYLKKVYSDDPHFANTKVIYTAHNVEYTGTLDDKLGDKLKFDGVSEKEYSCLGKGDFNGLNKLATDFADALVTTPGVSKEITDYVKKSGKLSISQNAEDFSIQNIELYDKVLESNSELVD